MIERASITAAARRYLGVRYVHQGRATVGLDCAGLVVRVARDLGIPAQDMAGYGRLPVGDALRQTLDAQAVPVAHYREGDILLIRFQLEPQHLAIVTDSGMIHSYAAARKVVEHRIDSHWASRIVAAYSFPGVAE